MNVKVSTSFAYPPILRQTPGGEGKWKDSIFFINQPVETCDAWFVYDGLTVEETTVCPPDRVSLIAIEPPSLKRHNARWLEQFSKIIGWQTYFDPKKSHLSHCAPPWLVGKSYDELIASDFPDKSRSLSAIVSSKQVNRGHRRRYRLVRDLAERIPSLDLYGRGIRSLNDKWDGLADYRYSIAIENDYQPHWWSEKIADCFLAGTVPIYYGCPNIGDYFPEKSFINLDVSNAEAAGRQIRGILENDSYESRREALAEAKRLVLEKYNLFNLMADFCSQWGDGIERKEIHLVPEPPPSRWLGYMRKIKGWFY